MSSLKSHFSPSVILPPLAAFSMQFKEANPLSQLHQSNQVLPDLWWCAAFSIASHRKHKISYVNVCSKGSLKRRSRKRASQLNLWQPAIYSHIHGSWTMLVEAIAMGHSSNSRSLSWLWESCWLFQATGRMSINQRLMEVVLAMGTQHLKAVVFPWISNRNR